MDHLLDLDSAVGLLVICSLLQLVALGCICFLFKSVEETALRLDSLRRDAETQHELASIQGKHGGLHVYKEPRP